MDNIILFGQKYQGLTFQQVLDKDLPYCEFIHRCRSNEKTESFKKFLEVNIQDARIKKEQDKILRITKNMKNI